MNVMVMNMIVSLKIRPIPSTCQAEGSCQQQGNVYRMRMKMKMKKETHNKSMLLTVCSEDHPEQVNGLHKRLQNEKYVNIKMRSRW